MWILRLLRLFQRKEHNCDNNNGGPNDHFVSEGIVEEENVIEHWVENASQRDDCVGSSSVELNEKDHRN